MRMRSHVQWPVAPYSQPYSRYWSTEGHMDYIIEKSVSGWRRNFDLFTNALLWKLDNLLAVTSLAACVCVCGGVLVFYATTHFSHKSNRKCSGMSRGMPLVHAALSYLMVQQLFSKQCLFSGNLWAGAGVPGQAGKIENILHITSQLKVYFHYQGALSLWHVTKYSQQHKPVSKWNRPELKGYIPL